VLWTPSGYYDASPGGDELIGWQVNRSATEAADFFPAARFRAQFLRPDVIDAVLQTLDEGEALRQASAAAGRKVTTAQVGELLPPVIELTDPAELSSSTSPVTLHYRARAASDAPVTHVRARVNGQLVPGERGVVKRRPDRVAELAVAIPPEDVEIQLFAENRHGVSTPATVRVRWTGQKADGAGFVVAPKLYVLAVGIGKYASPEIPKLDLSAKDARDFAATLKAEKKLYRAVEAKILTDREATRDAVVDGLDWLEKQVTQHDVGMLFLAGHGVNDATGTYYYLPVDAQPEKLKRTGVSMNDIRTTLANLPGKAIMFLDTCHAGNVLGSGRRAVSDLSGVISELASSENGVVVFSSSTGRQYSLEDASWGNGAFTKAVIEGLRGAADYQKTGRITHKMLDLYVSERVKALTQGRQSPVTQAPGGVPDFPLVALDR
jgi:hypothetical protein